jgi:flagellar FliJ protein
MAKPFVLQPLLDLSRNDLDQATSELGRLIAHEQEGSRKLEMLQDYRSEYQARFRDAARSGLGVEALRNYGAFMTRIDEAIEVQRALLDQSQRRTAAGKQAWADQHNRVKAYDTLHDRHRQRERHNENKREQREADEHVTNRFARDRNPDD